jgi:membrane protease YdiL (CAAX protease family)
VARTAGVVTAIAGQAVLFGLAHGASQDFVASPLPVVGLMIAGGLVAGWIVVRTGSLAIPIALHVAVDIPLYYGNACL